ncbi:hypothetical protein H072_4702 [Dactylellina haptotyla CBS 200.50]|uniref:Ribosome maturation protein SDO1/SBDS N-terminal domain-containing protein n=1 Tax=Dactylellina haptotyla (strain CBS 200.50) TaxID=1284197 RepID=S8AEF5_DACHA|nr:hypothetical protein H072_4702 [Dactylellina haptotyla CBS 200.50]
MRGGNNVHKVHLKKGENDFIVLVEDTDSFKKWKDDSSVPLAQVVDGFTIYTTHKHGAQGVMDSASKAILDSSFGKCSEDEIISTILREGTLQTTTSQTRFGSTNDSIGSMANHR